MSNRHLLDTYYATVVNAPSFTPTPALEDVFNKAFHANSFVAAGITPIWRPFQRAQVRLGAHMFLPSGIHNGTGWRGGCVKAIGSRIPNLRVSLTWFIICHSHPYAVMLIILAIRRITGGWGYLSGYSLLLRNSSDNSGQ